MRKDEKRRLKIFFIVHLFIIFLMFEGSVYFHVKKYHNIDRGRLIAKIGKLKVHEMDIKTRLAYLSKELGRNIQVEDLERDVIEAIILERYVNETIVELLKKEDIDCDKEKFLTEEYYNRLMVEKYLKNILFLNITEDEAKNKYKALFELLEDKEERELYHILLETEEEAKRISNIILNGNRSFETMAREKSLDKISAINGGRIGYIIKEELADKDFANLVFLLKVGELSKPIQTADGWEIVKIKDSRKINVKGFEDVKNEMLEILKEEKYNEFVASLGLEELKKSISYHVKVKNKINDTENDTLRGTISTGNIDNNINHRSQNLLETGNLGNLTKDKTTNILLNTIKQR